MRPNIFLGVSDGSAQYKKWYYELIVDQVLPFVTAEPTHLRVGWASTSGYAPYPSGGEGWGGNGVGDDLHSYGFDGLHLWSGEMWLVNGDGIVMTRSYLNILKFKQATLHVFSSQLNTEKIIPCLLSYTYKLDDLDL